MAATFQGVVNGPAPTQVTQASNNDPIPEYFNELANFNWSYSIKRKSDGYEDVLSDLDCIALNINYEEQTKGTLSWSTWPYVDLMEVIVDPLQSLALTCKSKNNVWNQQWVLKRTENNDRSRTKFTAQKTEYISQLNSGEYFSQKIAEYGSAWAINKDDQEADELLPTANQIFDGLQRIIEIQIDNMNPSYMKAGGATPSINP